MAVKGLMMHQRLPGTGMVVSRATVMQPRITATAKNRRGSSEDDEGGSEESLACARKVVVSRRWAALVLPIAAAASSTTTTLFSVLPSPPPLLLPPQCRRQGGGGGAGCRVELHTHDGCGLGVSRFPDFVYNAEGGGGSGHAIQLPDGCWQVKFEASDINIPTVGYETTTLMGVPLPPPLRIDVVPETLEGIIDKASGKVELKFQAQFFFSAGNLYRPPPLLVNTLLTTESAQGEIRGGQGSRLDSKGNCRLVGVARLAPIDDLFMSTFLTLPSDCLAELSANFAFFT
ncbi:unnamed protein product [Sphagnum jensenii]|uniref:Uncharacterized protein n=1 Tax=Sphagnum jensenii TaxID=128206 RepID=A0ABP0XIB4_9BRYO